MATIYRHDSPVAHCRICGTQRQFHGRSIEPHDFEAETAADFEPAELTPEQLIGEMLGGATADRKRACRDALREAVKTTMGVDWEDLIWGMNHE